MEDRIESCLCGQKLRVKSKVWRCPFCAREYELAEIVEECDSVVTECSGIGLFNIRRMDRRRK